MSSLDATRLSGGIPPSRTNALWSDGQTTNIIS